MICQNHCDAYNIRYASCGENCAPVTHYPITPIGKVRDAVDGMFQMYKGGNTKLRTQLPVQEDPVFISDEE